MDRERHEPTFSAPDLQDVQFRSTRSRSTLPPETTSPWLYIAVGCALLIAIAMGLIEWNARRQAAAMTRELIRPATPAEKAEMDRQMAEWERKLQAEAAAESAQIQRELWGAMERAAPPPRPLSADERCINGRRFQRIEGGWRDRPTEPCAP